MTRWRPRRAARQLGITSEFDPSEFKPKSAEYEKPQPKIQVIALPSIKDEANTDKLFLPENQQTISQTEANTALISKYAQNSDNAELMELADTLEKLFNTYRARLGAYSRAKLATDYLEGSEVKTLGEVAAANPAEISQLIEAHFNNNSDTIFISDSHALTEFALEAAKKNEAVTDSKNAILVFDNHPDIANDGDLWKGNVFLRAVQSGNATNVTFIGAMQSDSLIEQANQATTGKDLTNHFNQISIESITKNGKTDTQKLQEALTKGVQELSDSGIQNIVFSIDIDVLRSEKIGYSAMEYNPLTVLGYVGSLDLNIEKMDKAQKQTLAKRLLETPIDERGRLNPLRQLISTNSYNAIGLSLSDVTKALDVIINTARKHGIAIGIKLNSGGRFIGDIVELSGPDINGRTTKATLALANILAKLTP